MGQRCPAPSLFFLLSFTLISVELHRNGLLTLSCARSPSSYVSAWLWQQMAAEAKISTRILCKNDHGMIQPDALHKDRIRCDECKGLVDTTKTYLTCSDCDYDLCTNCIVAKLSPPTAPVAPLAQPVATKPVKQKTGKAPPAHCGVAGAR